VQILLPQILTLLLQAYIINGILKKIILTLTVLIIVIQTVTAAVTARQDGEDNAI
jgi:hypothetical protein